MIRQDDYAQHLNLGNYYAGRKELQQAVAEYERAAVPRAPAAAYNLAVLIGTTNPSEALALCRKALVLNPEIPRYRSAAEYYAAQRKIECCWRYSVSLVIANGNCEANCTSIIILIRRSSWKNVAAFFPGRAWLISMTYFSRNCWTWESTSSQRRI